MQTLDAAVPIAATYDSEFKKLVLLYAALCHDLGKVTTTTHINGVIKSIGHEQESKRFATTMLKRITQNNDLIAMVANLVLYHMMPLQFVKGNARLSAYKRLARKLHKAVSISFLADLSCADKRGRNGESHEPLTHDMPDLLMFVERAQKAGVFNAPEEAVISGADLMGSVKPGPAMGRMLEKAYDIQINEGVTDKKELLRRIIRK
jgi:tRNA nucleotidyltransferase (CCA-adding enzyme)